MNDSFMLPPSWNPQTKCWYEYTARLKLFEMPSPHLEGRQPLIEMSTGLQQTSGDRRYKYVSAKHLGAGVG